MISAIHRMWLYQQAYGFSVQRVMVVAIESWLGVVFVLVAVAGIRMTAGGCPRRAGRRCHGAARVAALNPERLIADRNIDRYEQTGQLDAEYLPSSVDGRRARIGPVARNDETVREIP